MDIERIIHSDIPDIAQVYGGVRGRTMSAKHQGWAWPMLLESGLKTVIDLRLADHSEKLPRFCEQYNLQYFHYPVDKHGRNAQQLVDGFDELCRLIDAGDFYIACAEGLHRTDIALCLYWMFYGADKGKPQPVLRGYLKSKGKDFEKVAQSINAFFRYRLERDGVEPIPTADYKERKALIRKAWAEEE